MRGSCFQTGRKKTALLPDTLIDIAVFAGLHVIGFIPVAETVNVNLIHNGALCPFWRFKTGYHYKIIVIVRLLAQPSDIFSDTTEDYVIPCEPNPYEEITIRFRTAKNNIDQPRRLSFFREGISFLWGIAKTI